MPMMSHCVGPMESINREIVLAASFKNRMVKLPQFSADITAKIGHDVGFWPQRQEVCRMVKRRRVIPLDGKIGPLA
jgi:hypothetical protein